MTESLSTIAKITLLSGILSVLIKYGGRLISIFPSISSAMVAVLTPPLILGIILGQRYIFRQKIEKNSNHS